VVCGNEANGDGSQKAHFTVRTVAAKVFVRLPVVKVPRSDIEIQCSVSRNKRPELPVGVDLGCILTHREPVNHVQLETNAHTHCK
jgi:hypothetical protein